MKRIINGKQIEEYPGSQCVNYFGKRFYKPQNIVATKINGNFIASKYNAIIQAIKETNANVHIKPECIEIVFQSGSYKIGRDLLVDEFLIPAINKTTGINSFENK